MSIGNIKAPGGLIATGPEGGSSGEVAGTASGSTLRRHDPAEWIVMDRASGWDRPGR